MNVALTLMLLLNFCWLCATTNITNKSPNESKCARATYRAMCVWIAKRKSSTPPGHLVYPLVSRGPYICLPMSLVLFKSDFASVRVYFIFGFRLASLPFTFHTRTPTLRFVARCSTN